jgi:hypothetical protein|tara:strand:+ start:364 stop:624 length:261 start_codon:yes stop_codon:yes gene_type:complete
MTCRQQINGTLHPRYGLVQDTHLDIAETLEGNLRVWLAAIHPEASAEVLSMYAEEIVDQSFDALHDLSMDIDASQETERNTMGGEP